MWNARTLLASVALVIVALVAPIGLVQQAEAKDREYYVEYTQFMRKRGHETVVGKGKLGPYNNGTARSVSKQLNRDNHYSGGAKYYYKASVESK